MWSIFPDLKYYGYLGMAGQGLFVLPEQNMVIVFTGALPVGEGGNSAAVGQRIYHSSRSLGRPSSRQPSGFRKATGPGPGSRRLAAPGACPASNRPGDFRKDLQAGSKSFGLERHDLYLSIRFDTAILRMSGSPDLLIGLDNRYRLTKSPGSRPVGLRSRWVAADKFELNYILSRVSLSKAWGASNSRGTR